MIAPGAVIRIVVVPALVRENLTAIVIDPALLLALNIVPDTSTCLTLLAVVVLRLHLVISSPADVDVTGDETYAVRVEDGDNPHKGLPPVAEVVTILDVLLRMPLSTSLVMLHPSTTLFRPPLPPPLRPPTPTLPLWTLTWRRSTPSVTISILSMVPGLALPSTSSALHNPMILIGPNEPLVTTVAGRFPFHILVSSLYLFPPISLSQVVAPWFPICPCLL